MVYGNTSVKLRFFGPWGEERFKEEKITVPYNFLPKNELEYTLSAGMLEDGKQSRFSRLDLKYGLGKRITAGAGVEYLSRLTSGQMMPFVNASVRLGSALLLSADYTYGVRGKAMLNYRMPANLLLELSYTRYQQDQQAIWQNFLEEHKVMISKPFRNQKVSGFSRLSINQVVYPNIRHTTADLLLSASLKGVSANLSTYAQMISTNDLNIYSNLAIAFSLPSRFTLRPQLQYGYTFQRVNEIRAEIEKHIFNRGFLNISYQNNLNYNTESLTLGLRFDLNFARASFSFRQSSNRAVFSQALSGGGLIDAESRYFKLNNRSNVGRGGLVIYPFLDLNRNNRRDRNEPKIEGLELKINGGRVQHNLKDTTVQIFDLEPYSTYLLELSRSSFDNIAWQLKNAAYKVTVEPNKLKLIEVPVMVSGEVSGMIYGSAADSTGQGRIIINFYGNGALAGHTLSESDGYINFLGLAPGAYTARIDSAQLKKLKMTAAPDSMVFTVALSANGDIVSGINFKLQDAEINEGVAPVLPASSAGSLSGIKIAKDINSSLAGEKSTFSKEEHGHRLALPKFNYVTNPIKKPIQAGTTQSVNRKSELMPEANLTSPGNNPADGTLNDAGFTIRINAVGDRSSAVNLKNNLMIQYGHAVRIYFEGSNAFELSIGGFKNRKEAEEFLPLLVRHGLKNAHIMAPRGLFKTANPGARVAFQLTAGRASNTTDIRQAQERIMRTLNKSSFPVKDGDTYRLLISGFTDSVHAAQAQQKLVAAGLEAGFITDYKETVIDLEPSIPALTGNRGFIPSKIPGHSADSIIPRNPVSGSQTNINPSQEDVIRFRVVTEKFSDPNIIRQNQELILKTLERPAYPVKDGNYFRLHISGFKDLKEADAAYQKLIQAGLNTGYITRYRERVVHIR